jgi:hypothetical protein
MKVLRFLVGFFIATLGVLFLLGLSEYGGNDNLIAIPMFMFLGFFYASPIGLLGCLIGEVMQFILNRYTQKTWIQWLAFLALGAAFGMAVSVVLTGDVGKFLVMPTAAGSLLFCLGRNHLAPRMFRLNTKS